MPRWVWRAIIFLFVGYLTLQIAVWLFNQLQSLVIIVVISLFLAMAIEPGVNSLVHRGWRRGVATAAVLFGLLALFAVFLFAIGALLVDQVSTLIDKAPEYVEELEQFVNDNFSTNIDSDEIVDELTAENGPIRDLAQDLAGNTLTLTGRALTILVQALSVGLFTYYLVADGPRLRRTICSVMRPTTSARYCGRGRSLSTRSAAICTAGRCWPCLSAVASTIAFTLLSVDYPLALGIWVGLISSSCP